MVVRQLKKIFTGAFHKLSYRKNREQTSCPVAYEGAFLEFSLVAAVAAIAEYLIGSAVVF